MGLLLYAYIGVATGEHGGPAPDSGCDWLWDLCKSIELLVEEGC